jgi:dihydroorotase
MENLRVHSSLTFILATGSAPHAGKHTKENTADGVAGICRAISEASCPSKTLPQMGDQEPIEAVKAYYAVSAHKGG